MRHGSASASAIHAFQAGSAITASMYSRVVARHRNVVDVEAVDDRREHRVGGAEAAEQERPGLAEVLARMRPGGLDARDVGLDRFAQRDRAHGAAKNCVGQCCRSAWKPACISFESERAWARAALPRGQIAFCG